MCLDGSFINWLWPLNRSKQLYAREQLTLSAWYAMSSAQKMTCISQRKTKNVATVWLAPIFGQSKGQITAQVLMKNRKLPTPQMLVNSSGQFLSGWYAISSALKRTGISERHQKSFYCLFIMWLGLVINRPNHGLGVDVEQGTAGASIAMTVAHTQYR